MSESSYQDHLNQILSDFFHIYNQRRSLDNKKRADMILKHKESGFVFGVELKKPDRKRGSFIGDWMQQAADYTSAGFEIEGKVYSKIPWLIHPHISERVLKYFDEEGNQTHDEAHQHSNINSLIFKAFQIGELDCVDMGYYHRWRIRINNVSYYHLRMFDDGTTQQIICSNDTYQNLLKTIKP